MQRTFIGKPARMSRGHLARVKKAARYAAVAGAIGSVLPLGVTGALAECARPSNAHANVFDLVPLASGAAVSSIIATISSVNTSSLAQSTAFVGTPPNPKPDQQGGGSWSRIIAGEVETKNNTATTGSGTYPGVGAFQQSGECRATTQLDFIGTQAGMDIGRYNFAGGGNITWGFTAGYFDVNAKDKTLNTFKSDNNIPFAGLYLALSSGNFAMDAQVRGDFYSMDLTDADQAMHKQPVTARGIAFLWNAAYRFDLRNNWFIEPSIGGVSSRTEVDQIEVIGGINTPAQTTLPGSIKIDDINSLLGRASVRIGTTFTNGNIAWQPFVTGSVFHEFAGKVRTDMTTLNSTVPGFQSGDFAATSFTSREGTFGHVGLGLAGVILDTGWLGYARVDYRFGDNIEGLSVNAGLRYQFTPAGDIKGSLKDGGAPAEYANYFNWTGFYLGYYTASLWADEKQTFTAFGTTTHPKFQGYALGGQAGYNFQIGRLLLGLEGDYGYSNAEGGKPCPNANAFSCTAEIDSIGFFTGRVGLVHDRAVYFLKGGLAVADVTTGFVGNGGGATTLALAPNSHKSETMTGWALGAGMEYAVSDRWSVKGEWMHFDLGSATFGTTCPTVDCTMRGKVEGDIARLGVNYLFGHRGTDYSRDALK
jgi:opacity protein-like surface antigen